MIFAGSEQCAVTVKTMISFELMPVNTISVLTWQTSKGNNLFLLQQLIKLIPSKFRYQKPTKNNNKQFIYILLPGSTEEQ
jgi:hypothetical protein